MQADRMANSVFYGELVQGKRIRGAPRKQYKDQLRKLPRAEVDWETQALDRDNWRAAIKVGARLFEQNRRGL